MKRITIPVGMIFLLTLVAFIVIMTLLDTKYKQNSFSGIGFMTGFLFGIFLTNVGMCIIFEKRYGKWRQI